MSCLRKPKPQEDYFLKNGGRMLEKIITSFNGNCNPIRTFSKKELEVATKNYHIDRWLDQDWNFILYRGSHEGRAILVKKFKPHPFNDDPIELVTNEVAIASNMSKHKNFLKLLGCCLETEIPILVYEFAENGNLSACIFGNRQPLPWESRLRIATEIADSVTYLHYGTSQVIIYRDMKSRTIFLDQDYVAKLFEFQKAIKIPVGKKHVDAEVFGTSGLGAPETILSGRLTEKSDVYMFGIVLLEIITGKRASEFLHSNFGELGRGGSENDALQASNCSLDEVAMDNESITYPSMLVKRWMSYMKANILKEGNPKQLTECVEVVLRCLKHNPDERPTMKEVAQVLRSIKRLSDD